MLAQRDDVGPVDQPFLRSAFSLIALVVGLLWLEWGPQRGALWVWLPLALPACRSSPGMLRCLGIDGHYAAVLWSHLLWVLPWMLLVLQPAWRGSIPGLSSPPERSAGDGKNLLTAEMPAAGAPCAAGLCHRLFRQHGAIHADAVAGRGAFRHADHRNRRAQQRGSIPILANRALGLLLVTGTVLVLPPCYPGSRAATDKDYVNAEGKNLTIEPLFREVNFCVPRGEIVTLMGPSGSGNRPFLPGWSARCQTISRRGANCGSTRVAATASRGVPRAGHSLSGRAAV
jgi:hypothetical protein